jgi:toxin ParE1/3/4
MKEMVWSVDAETDLDNQADHIALDNPQAAIDTREEIERQVQRLREWPLSGRQGRQPGTRELVVAGTPFIVVYVVDAERVEITRVLHGAQKWP